MRNHTMFKSKSVYLSLFGVLILIISPISSIALTLDISQSSSSFSASSTEQSSIPDYDLKNTFSEASSTAEQISNENIQGTNAPGLATVTTESEFWSAIFDQSVTKILLANNIVVNPSNRLSGSGNAAGAVKRSLIIDGQGYNLSYDTTAYTSQILFAGISGIEVTFQNMSMGSKSYPNNNYYGIFSIQQINITLNVKDFTYYAENGGQPFFADGNIGSTLNFYGINSFTANGPNYGGEFIERFQTTNFKANSLTNVTQDTPSSLGAFYSTGTSVVNLETKAHLYINSTKDAFIYGNTTINLADDAYLGYENRLGTNYKSNTAKITYTGTTTINGSTDSEVDFISNDNSMDVSSTQINSSRMKAVYVVNNSGKAASQKNLVIKRTDTSSDIYDLSTLSLTGIQSIPILNISTNTTLTISPITYGSGKSFLYIAQPKALSTKFESKIGTNLSNLNGTITAKTDSFRNVKVSTSRLYTDGDINSAASQALIDNSSIIPMVISTDESTLLKSNILGGQTNYIYYNVQSENQFTGYSLKSFWTEAVVAQSKYSEVTFPDSPMIFSQPILGLFATNSIYTIKNSGNIPLKIKPNSITDNNKNVILVEDSFEPNKQQVSLLLHGSSKGSSQDWNLKNLNSNTLTINPYFTDSDYVNFNIIGNYSGPLIGVQNVNYTLTFGWIQ